MKKIASVEEQEWAREPDSNALKRARTLGDSEAAVVYEQLAARGSTLSMINMGHICESRGGEHGVEDLAQAEQWYRCAVDTGSALAAFHFGYFLFRQKRYAEARESFSLSVDRGYVPSLVRLANLYIKGHGVRRDLDQARELLVRADQLGNLWAKRALARMDFNTGKTVFVRFRGLVMHVVSDAKFAIEKARNPDSERLKK